jgi:hypothetical protein
VDFAPYSGAISAVSDLVNSILKRALPEKMSEVDKAQLQQAVTMELLKADWGAVAGQIEVNRVEAGGASVFVAGWRPFVGWVCGSALAYSFIVQPFLAFAVGVFAWKLPPLPVLDGGSLLTILCGMLGLAGARTFEKVKGVAGPSAQ